jgi:hypothetical protein
MSGRAVVILTEPARCGLGDTDVLVQAMLQVQQLNQAGLAPSQAFCDHPAAAMKFIEAYAKAYPELQLRSSDLPAPEALYSIVADGRVVPLQAPAAPDAARSGESSQLYPLYVLSLGAPDALMRALQHNPFIRSDIQVVEIAPIDDSRTEAVSVAEAVAHEPSIRSFWRDETPAEPDHDEEDFFPSEELAASDALKLASVEVNLDHIQVGRGEHKAHYDPVTSAPEVAPVVTPPATAPVVDSGGAPNPSASGMGGGSIAVSDSVARSAPEAPTQGAALSSATPEPGGLSPSPPAIAAPLPVEGEEQIPESASTVDASEDPAAVAKDATSPDSPDRTETPAGDPADETAEEASGGADAEDDPAAAADLTDVHESAAGAAAPAEERPRIDAASFSAPGEDVRYRPSSSFEMDDDLAYPAPAGLETGLDILKDLLGSGEAEAVDLEALLAGLSDAAGAFAAPAPDLDHRPVRGGDASPEPEAACPPVPDGSGPDPEDVGHERSPAVHDLDI